MHGANVAFLLCYLRQKWTAVHYKALSCIHLSRARATKDTHLTTSFPEQPGWSGTRKVKQIWIVMKQEMIGWQWHRWDHMHIICTSLQTGNMPAPHHSNFATRDHKNAVYFMHKNVYNECKSFLWHFMLSYFTWRTDQGYSLSYKPLIFRPHRSTTVWH